MSASMRDEQAALDSGARYFLRKPYDGDNLLMAVRTAIDEVTAAVPSQGGRDAARLPAIRPRPSRSEEGQPLTGR